MDPRLIFRSTPNLVPRSQRNRGKVYQWSIREMIRRGLVHLPGANAMAQNASADTRKKWERTAQRLAA
jgi:hypothetical protein